MRFVPTVVMFVLILVVVSFAIPTLPPSATGDPVPYGSPLAWPSLETETVFENYSGGSDVMGIVAPPDGTDRLFLLSRFGEIYVATRTNNQWSTPTLFIDVASLIRIDFEFGLYSIAFPLTFAETGRFYIKYTDVNGDVVVARYLVSATNPNEADPTSRQTVLTVVQPLPLLPNHKGGQLQFGPDGMLYIGTGDGGWDYTGTGPGDPDNYAQNPANLLGKMLRIDVETGNPLTYTIPADNPFINTPGVRPEIWLSGLRNPWRFSFDSATGDLYIADVGQSTWEEIDVLPGTSTGGENMGWSCYEGEYVYKECAAGDYVRPAWVYRHVSGNCAVTGGIVYRGARFPRLQGLYIYGDFCTSHLYALRSINGVWQSNLLDRIRSSGITVTAFGTDRNGELYLGTGIGTVQQVIDIGIEPLVDITPSPVPAPSPTIYWPYNLYLPLTQQHLSI